MAAHKDASVVEFENTLKRNPASLVFSRLADSYRKRGDIQQAIEVCSRGLTDHPDSVTGRIILGRCFLEQEKLTEAMQEFVSVIEHDHRNQVALKMLADVYARQGMKEKAGDLYAYLCGFDPKNETLFNLVKTYAGTGKINIFEILGFSSPPPGGTGSASQPHAAADDIFDNRADGPGDSSPTMDDAAFAQTMKFDTEELAPGKGEASGADFARTIQYEAHDLQPSGSAAYEVEEV
ncbi:MAG TPA: tetratricopeptide repeat protein, partial [Chitinivibrionales bacterium]